jgi:hypothetical protein
MDITHYEKSPKAFEEDNKEENNNEETLHTYPENYSELVGYDHLHFLCKEVRNESHSARGFINPITPRLEYIMNALSIQGIQFEFVPIPSFAKDAFTADSHKLANVMVTFDGENPELPTIMFTAHHDIANHNSENCQDNTASVSNLIDLCTKLKAIKDNGLLNQTVVVGFTDCEEAGGRGIDQVIREIEDGKYGDVECIYALELTANGDEVWVSGTLENSPESNKLSEAIEGDLHFVRTPYNESVNARRAGLTACCIGILSLEEVTTAKGRGYCGTWALCHSPNDTFERSANRNDMDKFVGVMLNMIDIIEETEVEQKVIEE